MRVAYYHRGPRKHAAFINPYDLCGKIEGWQYCSADHASEMNVPISVDSSVYPTGYGAYQKKPT